MVSGAGIYELGDNVGLGVQFGTPDEPFDPSRVEVRIQNPRGQSAHLTYGTDPAVVRVAPGSYQVIVAATAPGRWQYRFVGLGTRARRAEHDGFFDVFDLGTAAPS